MYAHPLAKQKEHRTEKKKIICLAMEKQKGTKKKRIAQPGTNNTLTAELM